MKTKDPKSYWSLLNKYSDKSISVVNKVASETFGIFYDHFKNTNNENEG